MINDKEYYDYERMLKKKIIIKISKVLLFFCVIIFSVIFIYNFDFDFSFKTDMEKMIVSEAYLIGPQCDNLSFQDTAVCLNDFARENFEYNLTDDSLDLDVKTMMERGGDCRDFTNFYETYMEYHGFNQTQRIRVFVKREGSVSTYHVFLIVSHVSGYCNMDTKDLECYQYKNEDGEVNE